MGPEEAWQIHLPLDAPIPAAFTVVFGQIRKSNNHIEPAMRDRTGSCRIPHRGQESYFNGRWPLSQASLLQVSDRNTSLQ